MSSVQEIEEAIDALTQREQDALYAWMDERYARNVDASLQKAVSAGTMDARIREALGDRASGIAREL